MAIPDAAARIGPYPRTFQTMNTGCSMQSGEVLFETWSHCAQRWSCHLVRHTLAQAAFPHAAHDFLRGTEYKVVDLLTWSLVHGNHGPDRPGTAPSYGGEGDVTW